MTISELCLRRPIATMLFWISVIVAGIACWLQLPISALPKYDTPTIQVGANLSGASPETMSTSVATPLEKQFSAIPGLLSTTSSSIQGETQITLEFDPGRPIDSAAGDVQAALFRAIRSLPSEMTTPPSYRKVNPADAPILLIGLSSETMKLNELNAYSANLIVPALSTIDGVAQVTVNGQKRFAVRVEVDPERLAALNLSLPEVAAALKAANSNAPTGQFDGKRQMMMLNVAGGLMKAADFANIIIATRRNQAIHLADVAKVEDSIENVQNTSAINGVSSIVLNIQRQPGANTVATVDAINVMMLKLKQQLPQSIKISNFSDRSISIRNAVHDVNLTMLLTIILVVLIILLFLRSWAATLIPSISLPISLLGTFGLMYPLGLSLDNISLMGLTIAVGLVVDDAIVVLENIMRHIEQGVAPKTATLQGVKEVAFTVMSISVSLIAVFIPIFFMPGVIGLLFHEFAVVVSLSIIVSAAVSLTLIPIMVPMLIRRQHQHHSTPAWSLKFEQIFDKILSAYSAALEWALSHRYLVLVAAFSTFAITVGLYLNAAKGFFPKEDIGQISVNIDTPQDMAYETRLVITQQLEEKLINDPSVSVVVSKVDHDTTAFSITLKDKGQRPSMNEVLKQLRQKTNFLPGIKVFFSPVQNLRIGGRGSKSTYQYTLEAVSPGDLDAWADTLINALRKKDVLVGLNSDSQKDGLQARLLIDRNKAAQLGVEMSTIKSTLYAAFGSQQVSTIYAPEDSYQVIMELALQDRRDETSLSKVYVRSSTGALVPLNALTSVTRQKGTMTVNHQGQLPAVTISFDLSPGKSLSDAAMAIDEAKQEIKLPSYIFGSFAGEAALFQQSQTTQLWLVLIAVAVIYVVLGMLYESWIHPVTILFGIPSAAVGALLALRITGLELSFIAMIGILLLIGVVKKNAIMMIDFALDAQRNEGLAPALAIRQACKLRFRPIMMTTLCAIMGALPIAFGIGAGAELRQPLGVAIVGGLIFSQLITLFITPVLYLWFDGLGTAMREKFFPGQAEESLSANQVVNTP